MLRKLGNLNSVLVKAGVRIFVWVFFYKHAKRISTGEVFGLFGGERRRAVAPLRLSLRQLKTPEKATSNYYFFEVSWRHYLFKLSLP